MLRVCVLHDVRKHLARGGEDELLARVAVSMRKLELHVNARPARRLLRDRSECGLEPRLLEHVRVQLEDRLA